MVTEFVDTIKSPLATIGKSVESLTFDGVNLEEQIPQFRVINVDGRDDYSRSINKADSSSEGDLFLSSKVEKSSVTINYQLRAETTEEFNSAFTRLKSLLNGEEKEFFFHDEPEFTRIGTVTKLTNSTVGSLGVEGQIEITMSNPFRHGQMKQVEGQDVVYINDPQLMFEQNVDEISLNVETSTNQLIVTIGNDYSMVLNGSFSTGSNVSLNINERTLSVNGTSALNTIDITKTNIFEAKIERGSQVRCYQAKSMTVKYRVKLL